MKKKELEKELRMCQDLLDAQNKLLGAYLTERFAYHELVKIDDTRFRSIYAGISSLRDYIATADIMQRSVILEKLDVTLHVADQGIYHPGGAIK